MPGKWASLLALLIIQNLVTFSQNSSFTVFGTVTDSKTGEPLIGVNVIIKAKEINTITNAYGFYSLKLKPGSYTVTFHHVSYISIEKNIHGDTSSRLDIAMSPNTGMLQEVIIKNTSKKNNVTSTQMSSVELNIEKIKKIPSLFGEPDLLKAIQLLPGVNTANEGSTNLNVRGGSYDQNLILLDEATVYNPSHALGFFFYI